MSLSLEYSFVADSDAPLTATELAAVKQYHLANGYLVRRLVATIDELQADLKSICSFGNIKANAEDIVDDLIANAHLLDEEVRNPTPTPWSGK